MIKLPFQPWGKVLELGGGNNPCHRPNADIRFGPNIDFPGVDLNHPLPFKDEEWDGLHLRQVVEHISWRHLPMLFTELHRILRPGGLVVIETPNLLERCRLALRWFEDGHADKVNEALFGSQEFGLQWDAGAHHSGFSPGHITQLLKEAGFYEVKMEPIQTEFGPTDMMAIGKKSRAQVVAKEAEKLARTL